MIWALFGPKSTLILKLKVGQIIHQKSQKMCHETSRNAPKNVQKCAISSKKHQKTSNSAPKNMNKTQKTTKNTNKRQKMCQKRQQITKIQQKRSKKC